MTYAHSADDRFSTTARDVIDGSASAHLPPLADDSLSWSKRRLRIALLPCRRRLQKPSCQRILLKARLDPCR